MRNQYPLYQSHLDLAHAYWRQLLGKGDIAIDATCGNGHDTFFLADTGLLDRLYALDIQGAALQAAAARLESLPNDKRKILKLLEQSHETFPDEIAPLSVKLIVYNLGFLPGGQKSLTTQLDSTLKSIRNALPLLTPGGVISITCYSGHEEGAKEESALKEFLSTLPPTEWSYSHLFWYNRRQSPSLILLQKALLP
jgi:SAM-dependent methyltransferase